MMFVIRMLLRSGKDRSDSVDKDSTVLKFVRRAR